MTSSYCSCRHFLLVESKPGLGDKAYALICKTIVSNSCPGLRERSVTWTANVLALLIGTLHSKRIASLVGEPPYSPYYSHHLHVLDIQHHEAFLTAQWQRIHLRCRRWERPRFEPWVRTVPWRRKWQPSPVFLPGNPMDRGAWWATVQRVTKCRASLVTEHSTYRILIWHLYVAPGDHHHRSSFHSSPYSFPPIPIFTCTQPLSPW